MYFLKPDCCLLLSFCTFSEENSCIYYQPYFESSDISLRNIIKCFNQVKTVEKICYVHTERTGIRCNALDNSLLCDGRQIQGFRSGGREMITNKKLKIKTQFFILSFFKLLLLITCA